jgi:hypothetical protein
MRTILLFVAATLAPGVAFADFTGRVVNVHDGDTLTTLLERTQIRKYRRSTRFFSMKDLRAPHAL